MTYSADSPILGTGTVSAEAINAWFAARGKIAAQVFAPDKAYKPAPPTIGHDIIAISSEWGVNHDLVAAQISKESAYWQSAIVRDKNNPSGLGAVNDNAYNGAITFPTPFEGIRATAAHLMVYAVGNGAWTQYDPRYQNVKDAGWLGTAPTLKGLDGKWAYPGKGYGADIAARANDLIDFANNQTWEKPVSITPPAGWKPPTIIENLLAWGASNTPGTAMDWQYITVHNTANTSPGADAIMHGKYLQNLAAAGKGEPSWGYTVDDTQIVQHLRDNQAGYHASDGSGPGNMQSIGMELCEVGDGERILWNAAWLISEKLKARGRGIECVKQHHDFARDGKNCPRVLRANGGAGWTRLLGAIAYFMSDEQDNANVLYFPETGHGIGGGFRYFWENRGGLEIFGFPITDEMEEDGRTVQYCERAVLEYHPENIERWRVLLRHLGRDAYRNRYGKDAA